MATDTTPLQLSLPSFHGDIEELVRLVGQRKFAAADVPMSQVTSQFVSFLQAGGDLDLEETGGFLAASARLMVMKSSQLLVLPLPDEETDAAILDPHRGEHRQVYAAIAARLAETEGRESYAPIGAPQIVERRTEPRSPAILTRVWEGMHGRADGNVAHVSVPAFVKLEAAVSGLMRSLRNRTRISVRGLLRGSSRQDAVVHFLAVLELVRRQQAAATQAAPFEDITVEYVEHSSDAASRAG